jgi:hypothetical protein
VSVARAEVRQLKIARTTETRSTCPYCSVSCGLIVHTFGDGAKNATPSIVHVEGDPDFFGRRSKGDGQGDEALLLSDWSSLHLDLIAHDRGLKRLAASLYDFAPALAS